MLGDSCGVLGHNVLAQLPTWQHAHGKSGGGAGPAGQPLQPAVHEGAHAARGLGSDVGCSWQTVLGGFLCVYSVVQWGGERAVAGEW